MNEIPIYSLKCKNLHYNKPATERRCSGYCSLKCLHESIGNMPPEDNKDYNGKVNQLGGP